MTSILTCVSTFAQFSGIIVVWLRPLGEWIERWYDMMHWRFVNEQDEGVRKSEDLGYMDENPGPCCYFMPCEVGRASEPEYLHVKIAARRGGLSRTIL